MQVRIASTKATQKITKAMQMVAASKLRRAQTAAEAARPYAEKMDAVISNMASAAAASPGAPALLIGTGSDQVHLLLVCTGERGLSGAFNSSIVRLRPRARVFADEPGQGGQDFLRRPQGLRAAPPHSSRSRSSSMSTCARCASSASTMPRTSPRRSSRASRPASSTFARCSTRASAR